MMVMLCSNWTKESLLIYTYLIDIKLIELDLALVHYSFSCNHAHVSACMCVLTCYSLTPKQI